MASTESPDTAGNEGSSTRGSSPLSTAPSSPLSWASRTPSPPPGMAPLPPPQAHSARANPYPSPPASQQTSQNGSPAPDGMDSNNTTDKEGQPPAKRRRISKERTTEYLDLRSADVDPDQRQELDRLLNVLHKRQKIVVIAGAGISVSAGIPDFRSSKGLFKSLKEEHGLKGTGKDLFDASVYKDDTSTSSFHDMVSSMSRLTKDAKPTAFHHMLATIAEEGRLMRLYSQNVDGIDTSLEPLNTSAPLQKDSEGKWPRTVQLHGGLDKMVCSKCQELSDFDADLFSGPAPPPCPRCEEINDIRTNHEGKRSHGIGRLRPRMVLYNEHNPDDEAIGAVTREDLRKRPDAVIVAGTTLKVPGVRRIVREMCGTVRDRRGGVAVWLNNDLPPVSKDLEECFDIVVQGPCDALATRAAMRKWHEPADQDAYHEVTEEEAKKADARVAEVQVSVTSTPRLKSEPLPSAQHYNNSFSPPPVDATPKKPFKHSPDYSPMPSRNCLNVMNEVSPENDNITVGKTTGLDAGKQCSQVGGAPLKLPSLNEKLKDSGKQPGSGPTKSAATSNQKKGNTKTVKPQTSRAKAKGMKKNGKQQQAPPANPLTSNFSQSKTAPIEAEQKNSSLPTPTKSPNKPSKLRQVSNASPTEPMHAIPPQDARNNASPNVSPSKRGTMFPGLAEAELMTGAYPKLELNGLERKE